MFRRILVTTDGSALAEQAFPVAIELARRCKATLRFVTVIERGPHYGAEAEEGGFYDNEYHRRLHEELEKQARSAVDRGVAATAESGLEATGVVRTGHPAEEVSDEAKDWGADVIVTSTHGRRGIRRLVLGSVAHSVAHDAPCPALLVRVRGR